MPAAPVLTLQTGTLYASSDDSTFTGTGGPWGFSPYTSEFGGIVSSAGLDGEPFDDVVYAVASGDEVIFVIAVQNRAAAAAYDLRVRALIPPGFIVPPQDFNLSVTDGAGTVLAQAGDLFGSAGLLIAAPLAAFNPDSGQNVALITYNLIAGPNLPGPHASVIGSAQVLNAAAAPGGANAAGSTPASASTTIVTAAPTPVVQAETNPGAVARGQTIAFDITVALPAGTSKDLRLDIILPAGSSQLSFQSIEVTRLGAGLQLATPQVGTDGSIRFGDVVNAGNADPANGAITLKVVLVAQGTVSGPATLQTHLSAAVAGGASGRWSADVASTVGVVVPPRPPTISSAWTAQIATTSLKVHPLGGIEIGSDDPNRTGTLAVTLQDASLGRLSSAAAGSLDPSGSTFVVDGPLSLLQDIARQLVFTPAKPGMARLTVTVIDALGGIAQASDAAILVSPSIDTGRLAQHFETAPASSFLTQTADGQKTLGIGEAYHGPVDYLQGQYIYDGPQTVAITALTPNVFVKNFAGEAAVALHSGRNVVDAGKGSNFLVGGSGDDTFFLDGRSNTTTWDTIVGFNKGDIATLFGFRAGVSSYRWNDVAGAPGYTGRTMRADLLGNGTVSASLTFAGANRSVTDSYAITTGQIQGIDYMTIFAL